MNAKFRDEKSQYTEMEFRCDCSVPAHAVYFGKFDGDDFIYLYMAMINEIPWYRRLRIALKYIFRPQRGATFPYAELVLSKDDAVAMISWLQELAKI